jgi:hypothetical protein
LAREPLRAVYDDGKRHSEGTVRGMWSSGIVLETEIHPSIGSPVALVVLSGGFDGDRLAAQVAGFEKNALLLDLPGLDPVRWQRLQALVDGKLPTTPFTPAPNNRPPPPNAPVFIISGGEDAQGEPTGVFNLTEEMQKAVSGEGPPIAPPVAAPVKAPVVPAALDPFDYNVPATAAARKAAPPPPPPSEMDRGLDEDSLEVQLVSLGRENALLKNEVQRLGGLNTALQEELKEALAKLEAIEKMMRR